MSHFVKGILHQPKITDIHEIMAVLVPIVEAKTKIERIRYQSDFNVCNVIFDLDDEGRLGARDMQVSCDFESDYDDNWHQPRLKGKKIVLILGAGTFGYDNLSGEEWIREFTPALQEVVGGTYYFVDDYVNDGQLQPQ